MLICPYNNLLITIDKKFNDELHLPSGIKLFVDTVYNPQNHVTLRGKIVSLPKTIIKRIDYEGFSTKDLQVGDEVIFRYDVVFAYEGQPKNDSIRYKNEVFWKGQSYWRCDILKCFARVRDGVTTPINGYVICEPFEEPSRIIVSHKLKSIPRTVTSKITHIGNPLSHMAPIDAKVGDTICFDPKKVQQYGEYVVMRQNQVLFVV